MKREKESSDRVKTPEADDEDDVVCDLCLFESSVTISISSSPYVA